MINDSLILNFNDFAVLFFTLIFFIFKNYVGLKILFI